MDTLIDTKTSYIIQKIPTNNIILVGPPEASIILAGTPGPKGADSTVAGPTGPVGPVGPTGPAGGFITTGASPHTNPVYGDRWINSNTGVEYTYIIDTDSSQWVDLSSNFTGIPLFIQPSAPSFYGSSYLWVQTGLSGGTGFTFWIGDGV